jgi:uncharacterized protein (TIGR02996 family)
MLTAYADAFQDDILEQPDDDVARLIYADWLEDNDEPERAEFIRLQVELARLPGDDPSRPALLERERELRWEHGRQWAGALPRLVRAYEFRRGFVEWVRMDVPGFLRHAEQLFQMAPVRELDVYVERGQGPLLARCPHLARLRGLDLNLAGSDEAGLAELLNSHHLAGLRSLRLRCLAGSVGGLAAVRRLDVLTTLDIGNNMLGAEALVALWTAHLPALEMLYLNANALGDAVVQHLAELPLLERLQGLELSVNNVSPAGAQALARSRYVGRLTALWLGFNHLGDTGARALADSTRLHLTRLYLGNNGLGLAGVEALARSPQLAGLTHLDLDYNHLPASALRVLAAAPHWEQMQALFLRCGHGVTTRARELLRRRFGWEVCRF